MPPIVRRKYVSLVSSRGCPYQCMWCHNIFGKRFRSHSAERMIEEIDYYIRTYGVDDVEFLDDIFNMDKKRVIEFCELAQRRNLKFKIAFPNAVRTDILTEEVIEALVDTGLYFSSFALEAGSPRIQEYTGKRLSIPGFLKGVELAVNHGVFANGFAMLGFPTETVEDLQQTLDVATNSKLHTASFFTVMPFPNTRLYDEVVRRTPEKLAHVNYDNTDFASIRVNLSDVPDEVFFAYQRKANRQFFLKPSRIARIIRDYPQPHLLPYYVHIYLSRLTKGLFSSDGTPK
jgi:anaerobic magnesium-protoporphyrin IX monomethyl ester cyclase